MVKFAIFQNGYAIFAIGESKEDAIKNLKDNIRLGGDFPEIHDTYYNPVVGEFYILECTDALYAAVEKDGGAIEYLEDIDTQKLYLPDEI